MKTEPLVEPLTKRELEILALLAANQPNKAIAEQLSLSLNSVKWFARQIYTKLGVDNRRQAVEKAVQLGLLASAAPSQKDGSPALPSGIVTFLFTDIEGSTPLWEKMPEAMQAAVAKHQTLLRQAIEANGGQVMQIIGDAFQAAFRLATDGLCAALVAQRALRAAHWGPTGSLQVRMGLHTGPAELDPLGNAPYAVSHTLNRAARIMSAGHGGQVLLSQETADLLARELPDGVSLQDLGEHYLKGLRYPEHLYLVIATGLPAAFPPLHSEHRPSHNLPLELTSFIGRHAEITQVQKLLKEHRLVTLTGSGGVGKTRLSIEVAGSLLVDMPDGVWYVELAPIADPDLVPQAVGTVFGLREEPNRPWPETLAHFLSSRALLLVLDNCEHVLAACARLADALLRKAPKLKILTSSREALGIAGEVAYRVPSLSAPDPQALPSPVDLQHYEAVQLFCERAQLVLPGFAIDKNNAAAVIAVCQRLDGIPLALELATARLSLLTPDQLAGRLDQALRLLTGGSRTALPRQQTLRAAIDWSYRLLSTEEQVLLRRLAVFAGGGTLEAIEAICAGEGIEAEQILDLLSGLVNKSMVNADRVQSEEIRYRLLETVRQYTREKLYDSGEIERLRHRHLDYLEAFCEAAYPHIHGPGRLEWQRRLKREHDNIREALEWAFQDSRLALQGLRIAVAIATRFWIMLGLRREAYRWLNDGLRAAGDDVPKLLKARVFYSIANVFADALPPDLEKQNYERALALCRQIRPQADRELCYLLASSYDADFEQSLAREVEAVQIARALEPAGNWALGESLYFYAQVLLSQPQGSYDDQALAAAEEFLQVTRMGDRWHPGGWWVIGIIQTIRGQIEQARQPLEMALKLSNESEDYTGIVGSLFLLAWHHRLAGQYALALRYAQELFARSNAAADENNYPLFVYTTGMTLVNCQNDSSSAENPLAGRDAVRLVSFVRKSVKETDWPWYSRHLPADRQALDLLHQKLGDEAFTAAWEEGQTLSLEEAVAMALAVEIE